MEPIPAPMLRQRSQGFPQIRQLPPLPPPPPPAESSPFIETYFQEVIASELDIPASPSRSGLARGPVVRDEDAERAYAAAEIDSVMRSEAKVGVSISGESSSFKRKRFVGRRGRDNVAFSMQNVAEAPWLQEEEEPDLASEEIEMDAAVERFDWRERALSQQQPAVLLTQTARPPRRVKPIMEEVQPGELHYEPVQAYRAK